MKVLVLNSGSSSQKVCLFDLAESLPDDPPGCIWEAKIEWDGESAAIAIKNSDGDVQRAQVPISSRGEALKHLLGNLWNGRERLLSQPTDIDLVGHRVVHGGPEYEEPMLITPEVRARIAGASAFAPLHNCAERTAKLLHKSLISLKLVTCHLGNGCSLAAIREGHSIDTTMGFTPLEGLMMGTRSGSVDPGIITYLMRRGQINGQEIDNLLNEKSGLLGISGLSGDMRQILAAVKQGNPRAKLAFDIYVHRLQAGIGAMIAVLGGIDALVFTAGVGENSPEVRWSACSKLGFIGLKLNEKRNARPSPDEDIAASDSPVRVLVIRAQEDWAIARECWKLTSTGKASQLTRCQWRILC